MHFILQKLFFSFWQTVHERFTTIFIFAVLLQSYTSSLLSHFHSLYLCRIDNNPSKLCVCFKVCLPFMTWEPQTVRLLSLLGCRWTDRPDSFSNFFVMEISGSVSIKLEEALLRSWGIDGWMEDKIAGRYKDGWSHYNTTGGVRDCKWAKMATFPEKWYWICRLATILLHDLIISCMLFIILRYFVTVGIQAAQSQF